MSEPLTLNVGAMTCDGCSNKVKSALKSIQGINSVEVSHETGIVVIDHIGVSRDLVVGAIKATGYTVDGEGEQFNWKDGSVWKQSAHNTKWCLLGCSIGEFGTLAYYSYSGKYTRE